MVATSRTARADFGRLACCRFGRHRPDPLRVRQQPSPLLVNSHHIASLEFVRYSAVANTGDHRRHGGALLDEILSANGIIEDATHTLQLQGLPVPVSTLLVQVTFVSAVSPV